MTAHGHLHVTVPKPLLHYLATETKRTDKSKRALVAEILRAHFEPPLQSDAPPAREPRLEDVPSREEFEQLRADVDKLLRLAERADAPI